MNDLTKEEASLLRWLSEEYFSQYGECSGSALDGLIMKGLAIVHADGSGQGSFIAKGSGLDYSAVSLTETGLSSLKDSP